MTFGNQNFSRLIRLREGVEKIIDRQNQIDTELARAKAEAYKRERQGSLISGMNSQLETIGNDPMKYGERNNVRRNVLGQLAIESGEPDKALQYSIEDAPKQTDNVNTFEEALLRGRIDEPTYKRFSEMKGSGLTPIITANNEYQFVPKTRIPEGAQPPQTIAIRSTEERQDKSIQKTKEEKDKDRSLKAEEDDKKRIERLKDDNKNFEKDVQKYEFNSNAEGATNEQKLSASNTIKNLQQKIADNNTVIVGIVKKYPHWKQPETWQNKQETPKQEGKTISLKTARSSYGEKANSYTDEALKTFLESNGYTVTP